MLVMGCWEGDDIMPAVVEDLDTRVGTAAAMSSPLHSIIHWVGLVGARERLFHTHKTMTKRGAPTNEFGIRVWTVHDRLDADLFDTLWILFPTAQLEFGSM